MKLWKIVIISIILLMLTLNPFLILAQATRLNLYDDCPPNATANDMIWVKIPAGLKSPTGEEIYRQIPFDTGTIVYQEFVKGEWVAVEYDNYIRGVMLGELGNAEPIVGGNYWHIEMLKAMSVAICTKAYHRCGEAFSDKEHYGINGEDTQEYHYGPTIMNVSETTRQTFQEAIEATTGLYLRYKGSTFDIKYRARSGLWTVDGDWPHKGVYDPVGAPFEPERSSGLSQINANYWAWGDSQGVSFPRLNYLQILTHYYTGVEVVDIRDNRILTPTYRWTPLKIAWGAGITATPVISSGQLYTPTLIIQNSGVITFDDSVKLVAYWQQNGLMFGFPLLVDVENLGLGGGDDNAGGHTIPVRVPSAFKAGDIVTLVFDLRQTNDVWGLYFSNREADQGKTWFQLAYKGCVEGNCQLHLPTILKTYPNPVIYEPNDNLTEATPISSDKPYEAYIGTTDDVDWYRFSVNVPPGKARLVTADLSNLPAGTDYDLGLYDDNGETLGSSTNAGNKTEQVTVVATENATYYLQVYAYSGNSQTDSYTLKVTVGLPVVPK